jgi:hypothetical protein
VAVPEGAALDAAGERAQVSHCGHAAVEGAVCGGAPAVGAARAHAAAPVAAILAQVTSRTHIAQ